MQEFFDQNPISQLGIFEFGAVGQATDTNETGELNPPYAIRQVLMPDTYGIDIKAELAPFQKARAKTLSSA